MIAQQRVSAGKNVLLVDQFTGMTLSDMDNINPDESGYEKMAMVWCAGIKSCLHWVAGGGSFVPPHPTT